MKLNDQQREILQAFLDGKTVKYRYRYKESREWLPIEVVTLGNIQNMEYRIEEPAIKVALFERNDRICCFTEEEINSNQIDNGWTRISDWTQISDWVEITPNKELK